MLDEFLTRPIAHRGLHNIKRGIIENTMPAFEAAIAKGYGIECDVRPAHNALPVVFHDDTLERLIEKRKGPLSELTSNDLKKVRHKTGGAQISTVGELLEQVDGKVPLLIEIKSEWAPPDRAFLKKLTNLVSKYRGTAALMSFDPAVMSAVKELSPSIPRGIVSGSYAGAGWWKRDVSRKRAYALRNLLESGPTEPHFYAYEVDALPTAVTEFVRSVQKLPIFTWTVRTPKQRATSVQHADQMIFEGFEP